MRARVTEPTTGCKKEIRKVLPEANEATAYKWLAEERARIEAGVLSAHASEDALRRVRRIAVRAQGDDEGD